MSEVVNMREHIVQGFVRDALEQMRRGELEGVALVILPRGGAGCAARAHDAR